MGNIKYRSEAFISKLKILNYTSVFLLVLCFFYFIPPQLRAQSGTVITYQTSITSDEENKKISLPSFVYAEPVMNEIYVIDSKARIIIYTSDFFPLYTMDKANGIESPQGLTVDAEGNVYVAQAESKNNPRPRISVLNACLQWKRDIYIEGLEGDEPFVPYRLALDKKGNLYVAGSYYPGVLVLDASGHIVEIISPREDGQKVKINNVTMDETGKMYLVSEDLGRIYVYDENKKIILKFGEKGGSSGKLSRPKAIAVDNRNERMYIVDYMRHTVTVYNREGEYIFEFGGMGWGEGWFQHPLDIDVDNKGRLLVADLFNHRVQVFNTW
jgi:DNA-binding beta-propeller fold protein YncE